MRNKTLSNNPMLSLIRDLGQLLSQHDCLPQERAKTVREAEKYFDKPRENWKCAICARRRPQVRYVAAAHIVALEEGGTTNADNLIPLCEGVTSVSRMLSDVLDGHLHASDGNLPFKRGIKNMRRSAAELGCHKLFDSGLIARETIRQIFKDRGNWGNFESLRRTALEVPLNKLDEEFNATSARASGISRLLRSVDNPSLSTEQWFVQNCKLISAARRLANPKYLSLAQDRAFRLSKFLDSGGAEISLRQRSVFYYEKALLLMVQPGKQDFGRVIEELGLSWNLAAEAKDRKGWAMSRLEWVQAQLLAIDRLSTAHYRKLLTLQKEAFDVLTGDNLNNWRWVISYWIHNAKLHVKALQINEAKNSISMARWMRETLTVSTGWTQFQAIHLNTAEGALLALEGDYLRALKLLSRALIPMRAARGKRPEGFLDIARCSAWILNKRGAMSSCRKVMDIARQMQDGRSGFWPFNKV